MPRAQGVQQHAVENADPVRAADLSQGKAMKLSASTTREDVDPRKDLELTHGKVHGKHISAYYGNC